MISIFRIVSFPTRSKNPGGKSKYVSRYFFSFSVKEKSEVEEANNTPSNDPFIAEIEQMIQKRKDAKAAKDYALADSIRQALADKGVTLVDTPQGTTYKLN